MRLPQHGARTSLAEVGVAKAKPRAHQNPTARRTEHEARTASARVCFAAARFTSVAAETSAHARSGRPREEAPNGVSVVAHRSSFGVARQRARPRAYASAACATSRAVGRPGPTRKEYAVAAADVCMVMSVVEVIGAVSSEVAGKSELVTCTRNRVAET